MRAKDLFEVARKAHGRIPELRVLIEEGGFDWRPSTGVSGSGDGNPTEARALASMELTDGYRRELEALETTVGECLRVIEGVRAALGPLYADVLDLFYIDAMSWGDVADECHVGKRTAMTWRDVALDWVDSVGMVRASAGFGVATDRTPPFDNKT